MRVVIDTRAYSRNLAKLQERLSPSRMMAVVKDDAYGHGISSMVVAARDAGIEAFAVLDIATGLALREAGALGDAIAFAWLFDRFDDFTSAITHDVDLGVSNLDVLEAIASSVSTKPARVHLKIDSGLHRNGASPREWTGLVARARELQDAGRIIVVGVWTHIGEASEEDDAESRRIFDAAVDEARSGGCEPTLRHLAASAASFERPDFRYDMARVGGFSYGIGPGSGIGPADLGLEAVMTASARVVRIETRGGRRVAILDCGYLDGLPAWRLPADDGSDSPLPRPGAEVLLGSERCAVLSIDADTMSVAANGDANVGDEAVLFGSHLKGEPVLQEWADALGTVGEEIVVRVGMRAERETLNAKE